MNHAWLDPRCCQSSYVLINDETTLGFQLKLETHLSLGKNVHSHNICHQLWNLKEIGDQSMRDYVIKVKALTDILAVAGDLIKDCNIIDFVIEGLGPNFHPFVFPFSHNQIFFCLMTFYI